MFGPAGEDPRSHHGQLVGARTRKAQNSLYLRDRGMCGASMLTAEEFAIRSVASGSICSEVATPSDSVPQAPPSRLPHRVEQNASLLTHGTPYDLTSNSSPMIMFRTGQRASNTQSDSTPRVEPKTRIEPHVVCRQESVRQDRVDLGWSYASLASDLSTMHNHGDPSQDTQQRSEE